MLFLDGMGPRESIAAQLSDTVFFGDLKKIRAAEVSYRKVENSKESFYMVPFGVSQDLYGYAKVESPKKIVFRYRLRGKTIERKVNSIHEAKRFMVQTFIQ